jgi:hypothetical protein
VAALCHENLGHGVGCIAVGRTSPCPPDPDDVRSGQLVLIRRARITHAALSRDDSHFIALRRHWPWELRPIMVVVRAAGYAAVMRSTRVLMRAATASGWQAVRLAYLAWAGSAVLAGLMWPPEPVRSSVEGLLTLGVHPPDRLSHRAHIRGTYSRPY